MADTYDDYLGTSRAKRRKIQHNPTTHKYYTLPEILPINRSGEPVNQNDAEMIDNNNDSEPEEMEEGEDDEMIDNNNDSDVFDSTTGLYRMNGISSVSDRNTRSQQHPSYMRLAAAAAVAAAPPKVPIGRGGSFLPKLPSMPTGIGTSNLDNPTSSEYYLENEISRMVGGRQDGTTLATDPRRINKTLAEDRLSIRPTGESIIIKDLIKMLDKWPLGKQHRNELMSKIDSVVLLSNPALKGDTQTRLAKLKIIYNNLKKSIDELPRTKYDQTWLESYTRNELSIEEHPYYVMSQLVDMHTGGTQFVDFIKMGSINAIAEMQAQVKNQVEQLNRRRTYRAALNDIYSTAISDEREYDTSFDRFVELSMPPSGISIDALFTTLLPYLNEVTKKLRDIKKYDLIKDAVKTGSMILVDIADFHTNIILPNSGELSGTKSDTVPWSYVNNRMTADLDPTILQQFRATYNSELIEAGLLPGNVLLSLLSQAILILKSGTLSNVINDAPLPARNEPQTLVQSPIKSNEASSPLTNFSGPQQQQQQQQQQSQMARTSIAITSEYRKIVSEMFNPAIMILQDNNRKVLYDLYSINSDLSDSAAQMLFSSATNSRTGQTSGSPVRDLNISITPFTPSIFESALDPKKPFLYRLADFRTRPPTAGVVESLNFISALYGDIKKNLLDPNNGLWTKLQLQLNTTRSSSSSSSNLGKGGGTLASYLEFKLPSKLIPLPVSSITTGNKSIPQEIREDALLFNNFKEQQAKLRKDYKNYIAFIRSIHTGSAISDIVKLLRDLFVDVFAERNYDEDTLEYIVPNLTELSPIAASFAEDTQLALLHSLLIKFEECIEIRRVGFLSFRDRVAPASSSLPSASASVPASASAAAPVVSIDEREFFSFPIQYHVDARFSVLYVIVQYEYITAAISSILRVTGDNLREKSRSLKTDIDKEDEFIAETSRLLADRVDSGDQLKWLIRPQNIDLIKMHSLLRSSLQSAWNWFKEKSIKNGNISSNTWDRISALNYNIVQDMSDENECIKDFIARIAAHKLSHGTNTNTKTGPNPSSAPQIKAYKDEEKELIKKAFTFRCKISGIPRFKSPSGTGIIMVNEKVIFYL